MSKMEELINSSSIFFEYEDDKCEVQRLMQEYAEWYGKECLKEVITIKNTSIWIDSDGLDKMILNIDLPKHK